MESREDLEKRKKEVERLRKEKEHLENKFRTIEEEIDIRYPKGEEQVQRKHHGQKGAGELVKITGRNKESKGGNTPQYTTHE